MQEEQCIFSRALIIHVTNTTLKTELKIRSKLVQVIDKLQNGPHGIVIFSLEMTRLTISSRVGHSND